MKRALIITTVVGIVMLAVVLLARPAIRVGQVVESDGTRQYDYTVMGASVYSKLENDRGLRVMEPSLERLRKICVLPASVTTSAPNMVIRTIRDDHIDTYFNLSAKGKPVDVASALMKSNKWLKRAPSAPSFADLKGRSADGAEVRITIGDFSGSGSPSASINCGIHIIAPKR